MAQATSPGGGIRAMVLDLAHRPLQADNAQALLFVCGLGNDMNLQKLVEGVHDRMCLDAEPSFLALIGSERDILRGLTESDTSYAKRLQRALDDYQQAGSAWAVLAQILGYVLAATPRALTVASEYTSAGVLDTTKWDFYDVGANTTKPPQHLYDSTGNWDWDSASPTDGSWGWWRFYLIISATGTNDWASPTTWNIGDVGAPVIGDALSWSIGFATVWQVFESLRIIVSQWKAASAWCQWIIVTFDDTLFLPTGNVGVNNPDGTYGMGWKVVAGVHVASRSPNARYVIGVV